MSQVQQGKQEVIAYYSKTLVSPERNHCVMRQELLAVVKAMKHFCHTSSGQSSNSALIMNIYVVYVDSSNPQHR